MAIISNVFVFDSFAAKQKQSALLLVNSVHIFTRNDGGRTWTNLYMYDWYSVCLATGKDMKKVWIIFHLVLTMLFILLIFYPFFFSKVFIHISDKMKTSHRAKLCVLPSYVSLLRFFSTGPLHTRTEGPEGKIQFFLKQEKVKPIWAQPWTATTYFWRIESSIFFVVKPLGLKNRRGTRFQFSMQGGPHDLGRISFHKLASLSTGKFQI